MKKQTMTKSMDAYKVICPMIDRPEQEQAFAIYLNRANRVIEVFLLVIGSDTAVQLPTKLIVKKAILNMATGIILAHTHPSGNVCPSEADIKMTETVRNACDYFDISLMDHLIISEESYYSFADGEEVATTR